MDDRQKLINQMYWKGRAIAISEQAHEKADEIEKDVLDALKLAETNIKQDIQSWYARFAADNEITMAEARKLLTEAELEEFKWSVDEYIKIAEKYSGSGNEIWERMLKNASARVHIQRLDALLLQTRAEIERAFGEQQSIMQNGIPLIYEESLNKALETLGETAAMSQINTKAIEKIMENPWATDGKSFSTRIWENKEKLINTIKTELIQSVTRGDTHAEMTDRVMERMKTSRYNAGRLIRTETTYINARATQDAYKENNVEKVEIIGTLDSRVCELCGDMDGMVIDIKTYEPGVTVPPFHPMCRCTTAPAVGDIPEDIFEQLDDMLGNDSGIAKANRSEKNLDDLDIGLAKANGLFVNKEELLYKNASKIKPIDGYDDFTCHCDGENFIINNSDGSVYLMTPEELAEHIKQSPIYQGGAVRIISCEAGKDENGAAKRLAVALGQNVKAPTEIINVDENGEIFITNSDILAEMWYDNVEIRNALIQTGRWVDFEP